MRRSERAIEERSEMEALLRRVSVGHLGLSLVDQPYVVPVHFTYAPGRILFHGADTGRKMEWLAQNPRVCFEVSEHLGLLSGSTACNFSAAYRSVVIFGVARVVTEPEQRLAALRDLVTKYAGSEWADRLDHRAIASYPSATGGRTAVVEIAIHEMTGKRRLP